MWTCEECGASIAVPNDAEVGELVVCDACAVEYELVGREPLDLVLFEEDEK